ncbi:chaplin [Streptomyces sp. B8F3]|uniref:chaplin n=1 Tax=unclassified Streptomyces TaxID=2593676 RepID=UPI00325DABE9
MPAPEPAPGHRPAGRSGALAALADAGAAGAARGSPGLVSGNTAQVPVHLPVNAGGTNVSVVGLLNAPVGHTAGND